MRHADAALYRRARTRTQSLFDIVKPEAYYARPIPLRNPVVFYEGHLPAFAVNTLVKLGLGRDGIDEGFERLFARGIDPASVDEVNQTTSWPSREDVRSYASEADELVERALADAGDLEHAFTVIEHELMHQETLMYLLHQLPYHLKNRHPGFTSHPADQRALSSRKADAAIEIPAGRAVLGTPQGEFGWDNEFDEHEVDVAAFSVDAYNVTNADYLAFIEATGAPAPHFWVDVDGEWFWRGMFELIPLPPDWPVYATHAEAAAYCAWKGGRLMTEAEYHRALGDGQTPAGNFDLARFDPLPIGSFDPTHAGIYDLAGNGWEWTSTVFTPFSGFRPMPSYPQYSADFFDGEHFVMKGASPVTPAELVRRSFRNWFRPNYPYVYATFRCTH